MEQSLFKFHMEISRLHRILDPWSSHCINLFISDSIVLYIPSSHPNFFVINLYFPLSKSKSGMCKQVGQIAAHYNHMIVCICREFGNISLFVEFARAREMYNICNDCGSASFSMG